MIKAAKHPVLSWAIGRYVHHKVRAAFRGVYVRGPLPRDGQPLLVYSNHPGFWDGFVVQVLSEQLGRDAYCLVEEDNLRRFPFLRRLGAFSVRRGDPGSTLEALRYARAILARPRALLLYFPEGELRPFASAPIRFERGVEVLARSAQATCWPIALRYAFLRDERPEVLVESGPLHGPRGIAEMEGGVQELVERVAGAGSTEGFERLIRGSAGASERWAAFKAALGVQRAGRAAS